MNSLVLQIFWPRGFFGKAARIFGALSVIGLIEHGLDFGLGPTIALLLKYYDNLIGALLSWTEPFIYVVLQNFQLMFSWDLSLHAHWRHIFVLMGIYFFRGVGIELRAGLPVTAMFIFALGFSVAFFCSVGAGVLASTPNDFASNFLIAAIPVIGAGLIFPIIRRAWRATFLRDIDAQLLGVPPTWWAVFSGTVVRAMARTIFGMVYILLVLKMTPVRTFPNSGVFVFASLIFLLAFYWIRVGAKDVERVRNLGERWTAVFLRTDAGQLGSAMLGVFFWVTIIIVLNAGLGIWGL